MEEIAGDMDEAAVPSCCFDHQQIQQEFREQILDDVRERKEADLYPRVLQDCGMKVLRHNVPAKRVCQELKAIERKAAKDFNSMFKAMGDKQADRGVYRLR